MRARVFVCRPRRHPSDHSARPAPLVPALLTASESGSSPAGCSHPARPWVGVAVGRCRPGSTRVEDVTPEPGPAGPDSTGFAREARGDGGFDSGPFGVRRPLRFLAERLNLNDAQVKEMARIIDELKTERAQAEVDQRRTLAAFADAVSGAGFDEARAAEGAELRLRNAERLRGAVLEALRKIHALLSEPQREQLAYMIRTGILAL